MVQAAFTYMMKYSRYFPANVQITAKNPALIDDLALNLGSIPWKIFRDRPGSRMEYCNKYIGIKTEYLKYAPTIYPAGIEHQCILIKTELQGPIITAIKWDTPIYDYYSGGKVSDYTAVAPATFLRQEDTWGSYTTCYVGAPKTRCFLSRKDWLEDKSTKDAKKQAKKEAMKQAKQEAGKNPGFNLSSPLFEVVDVMKPTKLCPVKKGDRFQLSIPFISDHMIDGKTVKNGQMKGSGSTSTNWVGLYINGEYVKQVSPVEFPKVYLENFRVRIVPLHEG